MHNICAPGLRVPVMNWYKDIPEPISADVRSVRCSVDIYVQHQNEPGIAGQAANQVDRYPFAHKQTAWALCSWQRRDFPAANSVRRLDAARAISAAVSSVPRWECGLGGMLRGAQQRAPGPNLSWLCIRTRRSRPALGVSEYLR